jgi:hypothetical protein
MDEHCLVCFGNVQNSETTKSILNHQVEGLEGNLESGFECTGRQARVKKVGDRVEALM